MPSHLSLAVLTLASCLPPCVSPGQRGTLKLFAPRPVAQGSDRPQ